MAAGAVVAGMTGSAGLLSMVLGMWPPVLDFYTQWAYEDWPIKLPDLGSTVEMRYRNLIREEEYINTFKRQGISETWAQAIYKMSEVLLSGSEYIRLWRRGELDEDKLDDFLAKLHFNPVDIRHLKKTTEYFPVPADLVQFAVREVYTPKTVEKFGQMEDLPPKFISEAKKAGLPEEQARNFWAAHWRLPSAGQGYEMFHRDVIDFETLQMLLKALDVMPYWRERLIQISYNPLTRVDVRRMHKLGVLDDEDVYDSYRYVGYSPENATNMLEFTKLYNADTSTGLTRSAVVSAYKKNIIDKEELGDVLADFGYTPEVVQFWLDMTDMEIELDAIEALETEVINQYNIGAITIDEVRIRLNQANLPADYITTVINNLSAAKSPKLKLPTRTDLEDWLELQIIDESHYSTHMKMLGYRETDIQLYLTEYAMKGDTSERKFLPIKTYSRWFGTDIMSEEVFVDTAVSMGYSDEDITKLILETKSQYAQD